MRINLPTKIVLRTLANLTTTRPICVSYEVTHSCTARCLHCDKGGLSSDGRVMGLDDYRRLTRELRPVATQLSGGEPLLRPDLEEIARAVKRPSGLPLLICVTNGSLLSEERYLSLLDAGVNLLSISLDFPDERHDEFRRIPGLYRRLESIVPLLARKHGRGNIALNAALTSANFAEMPALVRKAEEWGVRIAFSAYSVLRTGDPKYCISDPESLELLRRNIEYVIESRRWSDTVLNPDHILRKTYEFFRDGGYPGCMAGLRFIVVRPDGTMNGCSMFPDYQYSSQKETIAKFRQRMTCDQCYVAIRAATERSLGQLAIDSLQAYGQVRGALQS